MNNNGIRKKVLITGWKGRIGKILINTIKGLESETSMYEWSKIAAEAIAIGASYNENINIKLSVVRIGNVIKGSNVLQTLSELKGYINDTIEYFQPSHSILNLFMIALEKPGCIITPLLFSMPVSFVAGFFTGTAYNKNPSQIQSWQPAFNLTASFDLLPLWWHEFTMAAEVKLENSKECNYNNIEQKKWIYLVTDFNIRRRKCDKENQSKKERQGKKREESNLQEIIETQTEPKFGEFISYLVEDGLLERNPHK